MLISAIFRGFVEIVKNLLSTKLYLQITRSLSKYKAIFKNCKFCKMSVFVTKRRKTLNVKKFVVKALAKVQATFCRLLLVIRDFRMQKTQVL